MSGLVIFGTCFAYDEEFARSVYPVWFGCLYQAEDLARHRIVLVDSGSDVDWQAVFPFPVTVHRADTNDLFSAPDPGPGRLLVVSFRDNIGHVWHQRDLRLPDGITSRDGAGRSLCEGLHLAQSWNADYFAHVEGDAFIFGAQPISRRLRELRADFTAPRWDTEIETNLLLGRVDRMRDFADVYDWKHTPVGSTMEIDLLRKFEGRFEWWEIGGGRGDAHAPSDQVMSGNGGPYFWTLNRDAKRAARHIAGHWAQVHAAGGALES